MPDRRYRAATDVRLLEGNAERFLAAIGRWPDAAARLVGRMVGRVLRPGPVDRRAGVPLDVPLEVRGV